MNASKEEAARAINELWRAAEELDRVIPNPLHRQKVKESLVRVENFLERAKAKLPREASYAKAQQRKAIK